MVQPDNLLLRTRRRYDVVVDILPIQRQRDLRHKLAPVRNSACWACHLLDDVAHKGSLAATRGHVDPDVENVGHLPRRERRVFNVKLKVAKHQPISIWRTIETMTQSSGFKSLFSDFTCHLRPSVMAVFKSGAMTLTLCFLS